MDPLSAAASIIAVVSAARKASHGPHQLKTLKAAPKGLNDLLAEFTCTDIVLQAFRNLPSNIPERSPDLLSVAERKFHELDALICYTWTKTSSSDRIDRVQWIS